MQTELETAVVSFDSETGIGRVEFDRPDSLNALDGRLRADIKNGLRELESRNDEADGVALRCVSLEGRGGNFCAGADVNAFDSEASGNRSERNHVEFVMDFPVPVVAKIEGYCLGGGLELAMACDFRLAHEESSLGLPEVDLGLLPGAGGVQFVSRLASPAVAVDLAMTGKHVSARRAEELGLVHRAAADDAFDDAVDDLLETLASKPPLAIQAIKESARYAVQTNLDEGRRLDLAQMEQLLETNDFEEAATAFGDDEYEPEFEGR